MRRIISNRRGHLNEIITTPVGLEYVPSFLSAGQAEQLLNQIDRGSWLPVAAHTGARRVQQFGARFDHSAAAVAAEERVAFPEWCVELSQRITDCGYIDSSPDQAIVNEYLPGQGIGSHVDNVHDFGPIVISITLGSPVTMVFSNQESGEKWDQWLEVGSLVVLSGAARYDWKHGIAKLDYDIVDGERIERARRVSVTFRTLN
ncbi:MAG: alpha-ketoglutarate-dependent dioxygenase AlkB [Verrucomicrobiota bacterium]